jgi:DNA-directed RNA polymerase subunit M/transcription elongation factor TFIIS
MNPRLFDHSMVCPKCGSIQITSQYNDTTNLVKRYCTNCEYSEQQLPLDSNKAGNDKEKI